MLNLRVLQPQILTPSSYSSEACLFRMWLESRFPMHVLTNITHFISKEPVFEFPKDPILVLVQKHAWFKKKCPSCRGLRTWTLTCRRGCRIPGPSRCGWCCTWRRWCSSSSCCPRLPVNMSTNPIIVKLGLKDKTMIIRVAYLNKHKSNQIFISSLTTKDYRKPRNIKILFFFSLKSFNTSKNL